MQPPEFCHWLQGVLDANMSGTLNEKQTAIITAKLNEVFVHVVEPVRKPRPQITPAPERPGFVAKC